MGLFAASRLVVKIDQEAVYAGGVVSGRVYAQIRKKTTATELRIEVKGEEFAHVVSAILTTPRRPDRESDRHSKKVRYRCAGTLCVETYSTVPHVVHIRYRTTRTVDIQYGTVSSPVW